jgi:general stress protein 26
MPPRASRLRLPKEYGEPKGGADLVPWSYVDERMVTAMHYWLSTVGGDGAPHVRPIAGLWLDESLYFGGISNSRWFRNLVGNRRACFNLSEASDRAVILHGSVEALRPDPALARLLAEASNAKYHFGQSPGNYETIDIWKFRPRVAYAWRALDQDRTRFGWD